MKMQVTFPCSVFVLLDKVVLRIRWKNILENYGFPGYQIRPSRDFPGGPVVKTVSFQCSDSMHPGQGTKSSHATAKDPTRCN